MTGIKIRQIEALKADFDSFEVFGFLESLKGGDMIKIYWRAKGLESINLIIGIRINVGFEADFKLYLRDGFIYTAIVEQIESADSDSENYIKVYKEILEKI